MPVMRAPKMHYKYLMYSSFTVAMAIQAIGIKRYARSVNSVREAYRKDGINWDYWGNVKLRYKFELEEKSLFDSADSIEVRKAKEQLLIAKKYKDIAFVIAVIIALSGFISAAFFGFSQSSSIK